jgi:hypothetical protein
VGKNKTKKNITMKLNTKQKRSIAYNGWVFVSGFALHKAQFKGQMLMAKLAQIPCYAIVAVI